MFTGRLNRPEDRGVRLRTEKEVCVGLCFAPIVRVAKFELVMFDFDGTLGDTLPWFQSVFHTVSEKHGLKKLSAEEYERLRDFDGKQMMKVLGIPFWKLPLIAKEMRSLMAANIRATKPFPETGWLLQSLAARGIRLGIVSSNGEENIRHILGSESASLIRYYECGVSMFGKPAKLKKVLRQSGMRAEQAIYIGDELRDLQAARDARLAFGAVAWGYNRAEALRNQKADEMFSTMQEIVERLA